MEARASTTRVDWRPYYITAAMMGLALAMNIATGNRLWFWYTMTGLGVFLLVVGLVHHRNWPVPAVAVWIVGLCAALHYIGGSLSGLHQIGGPNGLYFAFPWWDNLVHFLGSAALGVACLAILRARLPTVPVAWMNTLAVSLACLLGVLVELYEFAQFVFLGTVDQGFYTNNLLDLYYNLLGASVGVLAYARLSVAAQGAAEPSEAPA